MAEALLARFAVYLELGDPRADREFDRFLQVAARDPTPRLRHLVLSRRAMRALMAGDLERAEELIDAAATSARESGEPDGVVVAMNQRFELYAERGDRSPLLPILERFRAVSSHPAIVASLALARLDGGDLDGARSAVAPYEDVSLDGLQPEYGRAWVLSMLGDAFVALGARDAIRRTAEALLPFAGTNIVAGGGVVYRGAVDHHLGILLVAADDQDAGIAHLRAALEMHQRLGAVRWAHRTAHALASVDALAGAPRASMVRDGDVWTLSYATKTVRCKDSKGLRDLAMLLANPGVEIRATVLAGTPDARHLGRRRPRPARPRRDRRPAAHGSTPTSPGPTNAATKRRRRARSPNATRSSTSSESRPGSPVAAGASATRPSAPARPCRRACTTPSSASSSSTPSSAGIFAKASSLGRSCRYQPEAAVHWVVRQNESGS